MVKYFNPDHKDQLDEILLSLPGVEPTQLFGHPSYKVNGKVFASLMEDGITLRLPAGTVQTLIEQDNISGFAPVGPPRRNWVLIQVEEARDYDNYRTYFEEAMIYVLAGASSQQ